MSYPKKVSTELVLGLDEHGFEGLYTAPRFVTIKDRLDYTMWFQNLNKVIREVKNLSDLKLMFWVGANMPYNEGVIVLNKHNKENAGKELAISVSAIDKSIKRLKELGVFIQYPESVKTAMYWIHPDYMWKGDTATRGKQLTKVLEHLRVANLPEKEQKALKAIEKYKEVRERGPGFNFKGIPAA
jgi:hypothetical protein